MPQLSTILAVAIALAVGAHTPTLAAPQAPAPSVTEAAVPARLTARMPDDILRAEKAAKTAIDYTAAAGETYYFDANSEPVDKASAGGYYRKTLGKTADGRDVIQDYYQDNGKPQTAPIILKKEAKLHDFDSGMSDSRIVWYREDGSVLATQDYKGGADLGRHNYYQNGILAMQSALPFDIAKEDGDPYAAVGDISRGNRYYYPDGRIMAFEDLEDADNFELLYYRADGSPLMHFRTSEDDGGDSSTWNANGDYVAEEAVQAEIDAVTARKEELQSAVRREMP